MNKIDTKFVTSFVEPSADNVEFQAGSKIRGLKYWTALGMRLILREAEMVNIPFLGALAGCSARRSERRVASHTSEEQRRNAPGSAAKNGILAFSAALMSSLAIPKRRLGLSEKRIAALKASGGV